MGLKEFTLLGHSLGGFLTCTYALEHPENVSRLILCAPVGIAPWKFPERPESLTTKLLQFFFWGPLNFTPQSILRSLGPFGYNLWNKMGVKAKYRELDQDGWEYLWHNQVSLQSGDLAFMKLLSLKGWEYPLFDELKNLKIPLRVIYGGNSYFLIFRT